MSESKKDKTFSEDGIRPIGSGDIKVVNTFEEDGIRPIAKSPDYLVPQRTTTESTENSEADKILEIDGKRPIDDSDVKVVDTFSEDGIRPIMSNKYRVVDTLNVDGERPITSQ